MNVLIKILAYLSTMLFTLAVLFKVMYWPGGGIFTLFSFYGMILTSTLYFIFKITKAENKMVRVSFIFAIPVCNMILLGFVFKLQHWPGAGILLTLGSILYIFLALPLYVFSKSKNEDLKTGKVVKLMGIGLLFGIFIMVQNKQPSFNVFNSFVGVSYEQQTIKDHLKNQVTDLELNSELKANLEITVKNIHEIRKKIIINTDGNTPDNEAKIKGAYALIKNKDNMDVPSQIIIGAPGVSKGKGRKLQKNIENLRELLSSDCLAVSTSIAKILHTSPQIDHRSKVKINWLEAKFSHKPLIAVLVTLDQIEMNIYQAVILASTCN